MPEEKDIHIHYIRNEEKPTAIMTQKTLEAYFASQKKIITEGELWKLLNT